MTDVRLGSPAGARALRAAQPGPRAGAAEARRDLHEDRALLEGFRRGDRWALERVYRLHAPRLSALLRRGFSFESRGRGFRFRGSTSTFQVEDWVHEVFVRAFSADARSRYDGIRPYEPYLERIARNLVLDELSRKEHQMRSHVEELPEPASGGLVEAAEQPPSPEAAAHAGQLDAHVRAFVAALPEREREVYALRFEQELEQSDVAERLRLTPSQVKTSEKRIRESFREYLTRMGWLQHR